MMQRNASRPGDGVWERDRPGEAGQHERRREDGVDDPVDIGAGGGREDVAAAGGEVGAQEADEQHLHDGHRCDHQQRQEAHRIDG